jgi:predicted ATP-grasp superfamily ATP-dependent carboligase
MQNSLKSNASAVEKHAVSSVLPQDMMDRATQKKTYDALILDANLRQSLVAVRSLGRRGMHIAAVEMTQHARKPLYVPTFSSRWCERSYLAPDYSQHTEPYVTYIRQLLEHTGANVLFASSDGTLAVLRKHRAEIECYTRLALAKESALEAATNKDQTLEIAKRLGIGVPKGVIVTSVSEVTEAIHDIGLPAVVKPIETWRWSDQQGARLLCELVTTPDEARAAVEKITHWGGAVLFQQFLTGRREAVSLLYARGEIYARFAQLAQRTQPPLGGTSVLRQSIAVPQDIGAQSEHLIREIELEGYAEVEFRRDTDGKPYLMEINPRLSASVEVAVRSGVDFPYLLYRWALGEPITRVNGYQTGRWMRYLSGDIVSLVEALEERGRPGVASPGQTVLDFFASFFIHTGYDYFDWRDLVPVGTATMDFIDRAKRQVRPATNHNEILLSRRGKRSFRRNEQ